MKIAIGNDHVAFEMKNHIKSYLEKKGYDIVDFGAFGTDRTDYPVYAEKVAKSVVAGECDLGILICGTGIGISIAANKVKGIRAACCSDYFSAKFTRLHNDANVLCMGARVIGGGLACELVDVFINTEFEGGRHQRRVDQITAIENGEIL